MNEKTMNALFSLPSPLLLVGASGVGKTYTAHKYYDHVEVLLMSSCLEEDIGGLQYREGQYDLKTTPAFFKRLHDAAAKGLTTALFLDEIDKADRSVADTVLTLVGSRTVNNAALPESTKIILAANPPEYGGGDGLSIPMLNRCVVVNFEPDPSIWGAQMLEKHKSPAAVSVVQMVLSGQIPILESSGEGLETRTTSPRSLSMALEAIETIEDLDCIEVALNGLLTPNAASKIAARVGKILNKKYEDVLSKSNETLKESNSAKKIRKVIEI